MSQFVRVAAVLTAVVVATCLLPLGNAANAHHTYVASYDPDKLVTIKGAIASVDYRNPHIFFDLSVTNRDGSTTTWRIETEGIAKVQAKGLKETTLQIGAVASASGWMARDGAAELGLKSLTVGGRTYAIRNTPR